MRSEAINAWPAGLPPPTFKTLRGTTVTLEIAWAQWYARRWPIGSTPWRKGAEDMTKHLTAVVVDSRGL